MAFKQKGNPKSPFVHLVKSLLSNGFENVGRYYSVYRAWVFNNEDPENLHRLQLIIPQISGNDYYEYWAFPKGVPSAANFGSQVIPPKGALVWVEFEGGEPEIPVWSHGHFSRNQIPKDDEELKDPNCYWFITKAGHRIKINDTKNTISIKSSNNDTIELNPQSISLVTDKKISLGKLDQSQYHAMLGEPTKDLLEDIRDILTKIHGALNKDLLLSKSQPFLLHVNMDVAIPKLLPKVLLLTEKIKLILSNKNTLD